MKLVRSNKYSRKITSGIASILLAGSLVCGLSDTNAYALDPFSSISESVSKDENYYLNYYKITDEQKEDRLSKLDIKYPESNHLGQYVKTLVVKDNETYKIIPVIEYWDFNSKLAIFYDLFTEEKLFDYPFNDLSDITTEVNKEYGYYSNGYDFNKIENKIPYFNDKEIVEFGVCFYAQTFFNRHLEEFKERDGIDYNFDLYSITDNFYPRPYNPDASLINTYEYAKNYVTTIPVENQVTSEDLGLKATYREEDKYSDYWKLSNEEIEERLSNFNIFNEDFVMDADKIQTLVLKDSEGNYKVMNVCIDVLNSCVLEVYDVYSGTHLFDLKLNGKLGYDRRNEEYTNIDKEDMYNVIPYFLDKEIVKLDNFLGCVYFVENNYNYFVAKDHINYDPVENSYYYYTHLGNDSFILTDIKMSKKDFAKYYIISLPEELQVNTKDLDMKLDNAKIKVMSYTKQY